MRFLPYVGIAMIAAFALATALFYLLPREKVEPIVVRLCAQWLLWHWGEADIQNTFWNHEDPALRFVRARPNERFPSIVAINQDETGLKVVAWLLNVVRRIYKLRDLSTPGMFDGQKAAVRYTASRVLTRVYRHYRPSTMEEND